MGVAHKIDRLSAMASPWRRRRMCVLVCCGETAAALRHVSASGAFLETNARPDLGEMVELRHPDAGTVLATVCSLYKDGVGVAFDHSERSVAFALAAITADMSNPAA